MDYIQRFNITHPCVQEARKHRLFHSRVFRHTLTNNEFIDSVLVVVSLFLFVILLNDIITRIVYMRPRFSAGSDTITYFSQVRIVLLDNSFLLRWVLKFQLCDAGHYNQRNHMQCNLVILTTLAMFIAELVLVIIGLPANRTIFRDSDTMVRWESKYHEKGRIIFPRNRVCVNSPVLEGPNFKSESSWSHCYTAAWSPSGSPSLPAGEMRLAVSIPVRFKGLLDIALVRRGVSYLMKESVVMPLDQDENVAVALADNASTLTRNLQRNFDSLRNVTGLTLTLIPKPVGNLLAFRVNTL